jgi:hypothetical protein
MTYLCITVATNVEKESVHFRSFKKLYFFFFAKKSFGKVMKTVSTFAKVLQEDSAQLEEKHYLSKKENFRTLCKNENRFFAAILCQLFEILAAPRVFTPIFSSI